MSRSTWRLALLLVVLALVAGAAATMPVAAQGSPRKAIVFVQGLATTLETPSFTALQERLATPAWGYDPGADFLAFSYTGGTLQDGVWRPNPYPCEATTQDVDVSGQH